MVMPETDMGVATTVAERLRHGVADQPFTAITADQKLEVMINIEHDERQMASATGNTLNQSVEMRFQISRS